MSLLRLLYFITGAFTDIPFASDIYFAMHSLMLSDKQTSVIFMASEKSLIYLVQRNRKFSKEREKGGGCASRSKAGKSRGSDYREQLSMIKLKERLLRRDGLLKADFSDRQVF